MIATNGLAHGQFLKRKDGAVFTVHRDSEGVGVVPHGGGFVKRLKEPIPDYLQDFDSFDPDNAVPLVKAKFGIDEWGPFEGYWLKWDRWNGWAKPYFPIHSVIKIATLLEKEYKADPENGRTRGIVFGYPPSWKKGGDLPNLLIASYDEPGYWDECEWDWMNVQEGESVQKMRLCDICTSNWCWEEWFCGMDCNNCYKPEGECKCQGPK